MKHPIDETRFNPKTDVAPIGCTIMTIIVIVMLLMMGCIGVGGGGGGGVQETPSAETQAADVTATYGAEQFHAQLTAIAQPEGQP